MNDTTKRQANQLEETTSPHTESTADVEFNHASPSSSSLTRRNLVDEEEQVVTSTSNESSGRTIYHPTNDFPELEPALHSFITSPARITSSTGNDNSSSPTQPVQTREGSAGLSLLSEDDLLEQHHPATDLRTTKELQKSRAVQQEELNNFNAAMPTTSAAAANTSANFSTNKSEVADDKDQNHSLPGNRREEFSARRCVNNSDKNSKSLVRNNLQESKEADGKPANMVARDGGNNLPETAASIEQSDNHVEKIILKLPKSTQPQNVHEPQYRTRQQQQQQQQREPEHLLDNDPSMSNSCSNSSTNSSITIEPDTRKVEPLKINLHHGSHQHQLHQYQRTSPGSSSSSSTDASHVVPKITIKPLIRKSGDVNMLVNEGLDANATDIQSKPLLNNDASSSNTPIPKLTIKATSLTNTPTANNCIVSMTENTSSEPHIVPKLTIRAAHEEGGCTHTSVVPKLTIKIADTQTHNSLHSPTTVKLVSNAAHESAQQPPLPKLTIKTTMDGTSGSSILSSSISPASSSSNSFSSAASSPQSSASIMLGTPLSSGANMTGIPKLTIKTLSKNHDETQHLQPIVPKLTIKTSASGSCVAKAEAVTSEATTESESCGTSGNKIPKLTIKTGQEHAVIITQHKNDQTIPKLTIKTKSIESEEVFSDAGKEVQPQEKIPKITIKAPLSESVPPIPKLTISTPHSPKTHSSSLVVRQVTTTASPTTTYKNQSPDRLPKLMISRQDVTGSYSSETSVEKTVPKLTIKTPYISEHAEENKEKPVKIPKLTIRTLPPPPKDTLQSSEDSEDGTSVESGQSLLENEVKENSNKVVPKLTITNLGSPKLKLKSVLTDKLSTSIEKIPMESTSGNKRSNKSNILFHSVEQNKTKNDERAPPNVLVNGESSSSQEFCGFTETTFDLPLAGQAIAEVPGAKQAEETTDVRRSSEDMDIDEGLREHDPKIFKNLTHFSAIRNGEAYGIHVDNNMETLNAMPALSKSPKSKDPCAEVVDTVDLTSSPSPGSSPAHFNYTDADPKISEFINSSTSSNAAANALLLECLQRETSVIQTTTRAGAVGPLDVEPPAIAHHEKSNSLLLSQLTAPLRYPPPPPLQPRPPSHLFNVAQSGLKYPRLSDNLMANGAHLAMQQQQLQSSAVPFHESSAFSVASSVPPVNMAKQLLPSAKASPNVIDSIEILDTPEGSPRSLHDDSHSGAEYTSHLVNTTQRLLMGSRLDIASKESQSQHNNNIMNFMTESGEKSSFLKRQANEIDGFSSDVLANSPHKMRRTENHTPTMATLTILTNDNATNSATLITTSPTIIGGLNESSCTNSPRAQKSSSDAGTSSSHTPSTPNHRSRKQKYDHLLEDHMKEKVFDVGVSVSADKNADCKVSNIMNASVNAPKVVNPTPKKRGRPKRIRPEEQSLSTPIQDTSTLNKANSPHVLNCSAAARRVQLLRKRLAIDMVSCEQPAAPLESKTEDIDAVKSIEEPIPRRERTVRSTRRCGTPNSMTIEKQQLTPTSKNRKQRISNTNASINCEPATVGSSVANFNHFGGSNSSLSSACSSNSSYATTLTTTAPTATAFSPSTNLSGLGAVNCGFSMSSQIDLTMSSSSSTCSGSATVTLTTVEAGGRSMLPPIKALSSTDPLPDIVFQTQDFSAVMLAQQLKSVHTSPSEENSQDCENKNGSVGSGSGDDSSTLSSPMRTPGRGRGRGRGRGMRGGPRAHRLGRGASAVAKAIAMNRPRCVGGLKHTPDPIRMKGLITTPIPQVFEEDTRMSADLNQSQMSTELQTPIRQLDFSANEDESQSSIISNTSTSIINPNNVAAVQNGASAKRTKKKKMEVCAADETEYTVVSIAEYDWPPPKGCCPSKNRDTFMIQEQVANYLGIKSFKRKYPDLPRRQIDMEERNWLQEKGLVSEKMCDLGITAVWASDILDIMYADFYDKYEEYKDFVRQKHLRDIETKQKSLGLNITGRGLQARDRAMLSASKWNSYFIRTRKEERPHCLDLQNLTINVPLPPTVPAATIMNRSIADEIAKVVPEENIAEPPNLFKSIDWTHQQPNPSTYYPLAVVPGQYASNFKRYSHSELLEFPVNTARSGLLDRPISTTMSADDSDSNSETCIGSEASEKRVKIRLSRRSRSERSSKQNCDIKLQRRSNSRQTKSTDAESESDSDCSTDSCSSFSGSSRSSCSCSDSAASSSSSEDEELEEKPTCSVCQRTQNRNLKDMPELFLNCYTCRRKVHPSCIEMPYRMALRVRNYNWQCADCKCCIKCKRKQEPNKMLYCEQCDRGFHIYCLGVKFVPDGRWSCERCSICMRCGATQPEGLPQQEFVSSPTGEKVKPIKHKKVKWINEYRIDHITKLREHCSMLCVPCGRRTTTKRVHISTPNSSQNNQGNNSRNSNNTSQNQQQQQHSPQISQKSQLSPAVHQTSTNSSSLTGSSYPLTTNTHSATIVGKERNSKLSTGNSVETTLTSTSTSPTPPPVVA